NDRGPFIADRIIDLSVRAARAIDLVRRGVVFVKLQILSQGTVPRRTALGTPLDAGEDGALEPLRAEDDLVVSLDRGYEGAPQCRGSRAAQAGRVPCEGATAPFFHDLSTPLMRNALSGTRERRFLRGANLCIAGPARRYKLPPAHWGPHLHGA